MPEATTEERLSRARAQMLLRFPWYGCLSLNLQFVENKSIKTFATDGSKIFYNPAFAAKLTAEELIGVEAHETAHCALLHPWRRGTRNPRKFNRATDYVINGELLRAGFTLPKGILHDPKYVGMSSEQVYALLPDEPEDKNGGGNDSPTGDVMDAPEDGNGGSNQGEEGTIKNVPGMSENDWKVAAEQATNAVKAAGRDPGGIEEAVRKARESKEDWKTVLREFIVNTIPTDYSWVHPNRRYIADNIYLPGVTKENVGRIVVVMDTSGSMGQAELAAGQAEINTIMQEVHPEGVDVLHCDSKVHKIDHFENGEDVELKAVGRGGTAFGPAFDAIAEMDELPVCCIYFTDLDNSDTDVKEPEGYPVLWVTDERISKVAPFGRTMRITID